jgi:DNA-binding transcriptional LysR family regulator
MKQMNYSLRQLRIFVTVAHARSFSRAGEMIGLSQSAVSHSVKELENQTGVKLLDRTTREVVLTEAGQQLALRLERLLDELNSTLSRNVLPREVIATRTLILSCMTGRSSGCWRASAREMWILVLLSIPARRAIWRVKAYFPSHSCCSAVTTTRWQSCRKSAGSL